MIPTTLNFFKKYSNLYQFDEGSPEYLIDIEDFEIAMIEFAKLHVEAALKEASKKAETIHDGSVLAEICNFSDNPLLKDIKLNDLIYKPSILNAYSLTNIN
jgi:hypothetical protein